MAVRRGAGGGAAGGTLRRRYALAGVAPAAAPDRYHFRLLARRHAGAARLGRFMAGVRGAATARQPPARAALARRPGAAGTVPLRDYGHALQDHAFSQLAAFAAA